MEDAAQEGRNAHARRAWADACDAFLRAREGRPLEPDDVERLA